MTVEDQRVHKDGIDIRGQEGRNGRGRRTGGIQRDGGTE